MSKSFTLNQLTEGIRDRHLGQEASRIQEKWTRTGLLRGLTDHNRENMSRLLENQAAQVLREQNVLGSAGTAQNIDGFSSIAFPIVRRVFGGLVANELVSIQPMSLPSGLLFYLDYSYGSSVGGEDSGNSQGNQALASDASSYSSGQSLYGEPGGASIRSGANAVGGQYDLAGTGYSKVHKTAEVKTSGTSVANTVCLADATGTNSDDSIGAYNSSGAWTGVQAIDSTTITQSENLRLLQYDPQIVKEITEHNSSFQFLLLTFATGTSGELVNDLLDRTLAKSISLTGDNGEATTDLTGIELLNPGGVLTTDSAGDAYQNGSNLYNIRRLNAVGTWDESNHKWTFDAINGNDLLLVLKGDYTGGNIASDIDDLVVNYPILDAVTAAGGTGGVVTIPSFESSFDATPLPIIPEIDIKIESIAVTAQTRKLRARWSPELAQDLNAYHSMDAEVELTQILSEQIALEIDREILNDLLVEARGANFFWSRSPGKFVNKRSGAEIARTSSLNPGPAFTGTVREWYETLVETIIDVANEIHRKTLRGSANFLVVSPEVATIFEASVLYKPSVKIDGQGQAAISGIGAEAIGSLSNRFTVYKDPYFPRNKILVGYKGGSYLESGYVYAPYVPLIVTPTIFAPEDFTPRKGVMTRYGKKMVRADFYGTVTCIDMDVI